MTLRTLLLFLALASFACGSPPALGPNDGDVEVADGGTDAAIPEDAQLPPRAPFCDDGNLCTRDLRDGSGVCLFEPVSDGAFCDDGDLCTLGDRCSAGVCAPGTRSTAPASILGETRSFGTREGQALMLDGGRALFMDFVFGVTQYTLARLGDGVERLDSLESDDPPLIEGRGAAAASVGNDLVAIFDATSRRLVVLGAEDDRLSILSRTSFDGTGQPIALAGSHGRLWMCGHDFFEGYILSVLDVSDPSAPELTGRTMLGEEECGTIAFSEDGERAYVATVSGVRRYDARSFPPAGGDVVGPPAIVSVSRGVLSMHTADSIELVREIDLAEIASVPSLAFSATATENGIVVEEARETEIGTDIVLALLSLEDGSRRSEIVEQRSAYSFEPPMIPMVSDGSRVMGLARRFFDVTSDVLRELEPRVPGTIDYLEGRGNALVARSRYSSLRFDVADPSAPRLAAGGVREREAELLLELPDDGPMRLWNDVNVFSLEDVRLVHIETFRNEVVLRRARIADDETETDLGTVELPRGESFLRAVGDVLYRVTFGARGNMRLELFGRETLSGQENASPEQSFELVAAEPLAVTAEHSYVSFDVDPRARRAVVSVALPNGDASESRLYVVDLASGDVRSFTIAELVTSVAIADRYIAYDPGPDLVFAELDGDELREVSRIGGAYVDSLLAFDGARAYWRSLYDLEVAELGATEVAFTYDTFTNVSALAEVDSGLAIASSSELDVLSPYCSP
jgi:hypothetical protein